MRNIASTRPYDHEGAEQLGDEAGETKRRLAERATRVASLRADREAIHADLIADLGSRVAVAGVVVEDVRITHLAYAPEIAGAMLKRQQAGAIISTRRQIVEGAVAIVRHHRPPGAAGGRSPGHYFRRCRAGRHGAEHAHHDRRGSRGDAGGECGGEG